MLVDKENKFWPYSPRKSMTFSAITLIVFLLLFVVLKLVFTWPTPADELKVLTGIFLLSMFPIIFALIDLLIERGGSFELAGFKLQFAQLPVLSNPEFTVPTNVEQVGQAVPDTGSSEIINALKEASACDIVLVDLETGQAWWETRLFILLAGATRLGQPEKVVFLSRHLQTDGAFVAWGYSRDLFPLMMHVHPKYIESYQYAQTIAKQWDLVPPLAKSTNEPQSHVPPCPEWMSKTSYNENINRAFESGTAIPNRFFAEQILARHIINEVESGKAPRLISTQRLNTLFNSVLHKGAIELNLPATNQIEAILALKSEYAAITYNGQYQSLISRDTLLREVFKSQIKIP